jgi:hypothetical protein
MEKQYQEPCLNEQGYCKKPTEQYPKQIQQYPTLHLEVIVSDEKVLDVIVLQWAYLS